MQREGAQIIFDETEQREFGLPVQTTVEDSVEIGESLMAAAVTLQQHIGMQQMDGHESHATLQELNRRAYRAARLFAVARTILGLCEPELAARLLQDLELE